MKRTLAALALLAAATPAVADIWVVGSVTSIHFKNNNYNTNNLGLGIEYEFNDRWRLLAGFYNNSVSRHSNYVGASYMPWKAGNFRLGAILGIVSGYEEEASKNYNGFIPMAAPMVSWEKKNYGINTIVIPPISKNVSGMIGFQFKFKF